MLLSYNEIAMKRIINYTITTKDQGKSVRSFLREHRYSKSILISMKPYPEAILLNGKHPFMSDLLSCRDVLTMTIPDEEYSEGILPVPVDFSVVYEDEDILVVNKPANTPIHPSVGNYDNTLANGVMYYYQQQGMDFLFRCINRLDRDTTGLLIIAKNPLSAAILSGSLRERKIHRTYMALVQGKLCAAGTVDLPIGRRSDSMIERCIDPIRGERAVTHYRPLSADIAVPPDWSLLELRLDTGRTHQIRVHMTAIGHPLLGDSLYFPGDTSGMPRQALHSWKLTFPHPITGEEMSFTSEMPADFKKLLNTQK